MKKLKFKNLENCMILKYASWVDVLSSSSPVYVYVWSYFGIVTYDFFTLLAGVGV